jgi:hypothetical protein
MVPALLNLVEQNIKEQIYFQLCRIIVHRLKKVLDPPPLQPHIKHYAIFIKLIKRVYEQK